MRHRVAHRAPAPLTPSLRELADHLSGVRRHPGCRGEDYGLTRLLGPEGTLRLLQEGIGGAEEETLVGTVERVVYRREDTGFAVVRVLTEDGRRVTAVGELATLTVGETVSLTGSTVQHPTYGPQFRVQGVRHSPPGSEKGIERYLAGAVPGVGPATARKLVEAFGADTLRVVTEEPERLLSVPGIGPAVARRIHEAALAHRDVQHVMAALQAYDVSPTLASRILKRYGDRAARVVQQDPYRLAREVEGIGFLRADRIARSLGFGERSRERLTAAALHVLRQATEEGHVYLPEGELHGRLRELLQLPEEDPLDLEEIVSLLAQEGEVVREQGRVYLRSLHRAERDAALALARLLRGRARGVTMSRGATVGLSEGQQQALALALREPVTVVTGGPGTGKTTLVRRLLEVLEGAGQRVLLAAPTGRAARRLREATGRPASTLHRLLEFRGGSTPGFQRDAQHPLEADAIVVDEVSMVDVLLLRSFLDAVPEGTRLVLVGDADQLPSVGPGAVLSDLLAAGVPSVALREVFRQGERSGIVRLAHAVNSGILPWKELRGEDVLFVPEETPEATQARVRRLVLEELPRRAGLDPYRDIQIITPGNRHACGVEALNALLQEALNPERPDRAEVVLRGEGRVRRLREGDRVLQLRNDYQRMVFNGDMGTVVRVDPQARVLLVRFPEEEGEREVAYGAEDVSSLSLGYAISVHKSQGSEFPAVVIPLTTQHYVLLQRSLLYTAITRARRLVALVGSRRALAIAVSRAEQRRRYTSLGERLQELLSGVRSGDTASSG